MNPKVLRLRLYLIAILVVAAPLGVTSFTSNAKSSCFRSARYPARSSSPSPSSCQSSSTTTSSSNDSNSNKNDSDQTESAEDQQGQEYHAQQQEEDLSDLDARVLRSMLNDGSLDLLTEDDMRQLLDRASGPKDASLPPIPSSDSDYESKTLQALMDTKLWKALSAKKDDLLESAKIFIENRIERDTRLLASLGIFVWDRVVRDVARALPAASSSSGAAGRAVRTATRQLQGSTTTTGTGTTTAGGDVDETVKVTDERKLEDLDLYEEMNTPLDEIKSVTQAIQDILKGEASSTASQRGIRTAAPAGQKTRTERQQRAYQKRKQTVLKREKEGVDVLRVAGKVVDAAYEVRRDLQVEVNKPGYKTERVRTAIAAGAVTTSRVIAAARDGSRGSWKNILFGTKEKEQVLELESAEATLPEIQELPELPTIPDEPMLVVPVVPLPAELLDEQDSVVSRLKLCIEKPEDTWLTQEVLASSNALLNTDALRDVVTAMIIARDDLDVKVSESKSMKELIGSLRKVKSTIDTVVSIAETSSTMEVANNLRNILYGYDPADEIQPTLLSIDEIQTIYLRDIREAEAAAEAAYEEAVAARERVIIEWEQAFDERERLIQEAKEFAAKVAAAAEEAALKRERERTETAVAANVVLADDAAIDASFEKSTSTSTVPRFKTPNVEVMVDDDFQSAVAEIIFDDSVFDDQDDVLRSISDATDDEVDERNLLADATLRSLDIAFAVVEKVILLLPGVVKVTTIASSRLDEASRGGLGRIGWSRLVHTQTGSKRY